MDEAELSQILKEAFRLYGSQIAEAFNVPPPLHPLLKNEPAIVQLLLKRDQIQINQFDLDAFTAEINDLKKTVSSQKTEIKSLNLLLECQTKKEEQDVKLDDLPDEDIIKLKEKIAKMPPEELELTVDIPSEKQETKPKKKKRKKK